MKQSERPAKLATPKVINMIQREFILHKSTNVLSVASKVKLIRNYISKIKDEKLGIKARVQQAALKYSSDQESRANSCPKKVGAK